MHCCCLHVNYIVHKYFDRSLHIRVIGSYLCAKFQTCTSEIQGFKLKNKNDRENWRNGLFAISPMFVVQFSPNFRCTYILTSAIILQCIITESESVNLKFRMYRQNRPRPCPSLYTKCFRTLWFSNAYTYYAISEPDKKLLCTTLQFLSVWFYLQALAQSTLTQSLATDIVVWLSNDKSCFSHAFRRKVQMPILFIFLPHDYVW